MGKPIALRYPVPRQADVVDDYHGSKVADPYRWMEELESKEVADWVAASNSATESYLRDLPLRQHFRTRLTELWNYPRVSVPVIQQGRLFYSRNSGLQRQAPVFVRAGIAAQPQLVIDPNAISPDGALSLAQWAPSPEAHFLAYALAEGGADWQTIRVREIASGKDLADEVRWMRFSALSWTKDSKGFYYSRYPEPPKNKVLEASLSRHAIYYHRIGTSQQEDVLVYERSDFPGWILVGSVSEDGRYLFIAAFEGAEHKNRLYYADLGDPLAPDVVAPVSPLFEANDAEYAPIENKGSTLYLRSDKDAPNRKVIAVDLNRRGSDKPRTVVSEGLETLDSVRVIGDRIVGLYLVDVQSRLKLFDLHGQPQGEIPLPGAGSVGEIAGRTDEPGIWYNFSSPLAPSTVFTFDPASGKSSAFEAPAPPVDAVLFETIPMFAASRDGTRVPFFLTARKNLPRDGSNPVMMLGYGGFSVTMLPAYIQPVPAWLERGGVWVTVSLRGGGEYGEEWHRAGMLERKQNVFDDFIAVAEHLVTENYTSSVRLGMMGGSNGGLLVGAVMEQRPDLFAVALPAVGVMDMLRYDKFTGGALWATEYGSASDPAQFPFLFRYSPLHNLKRGTCYPATLITTADHDDRVVPSHSFKFAAALQAAQGCDNPVLIRVVQGSHGYQPTDRLIAERADQWAFAAEHLGMR
jgi:prolyl oligopeptidase